MHNDEAFFVERQVSSHAKTSFLQFVPMALFLVHKDILAAHKKLSAKIRRLMQASRGIIVTSC